MTYVEEQKRGSKTYYYLVKNVRTGNNKWKKIREYLGDKKPTAQDIQKKTKEIEERTPKQSPFSYLSLEDAETLQDLKESYKAWLKRTPASVRKKLDEDFVIRFTYHTNAIEGNRLTLRETALILKDKVIPSGVRAIDYNEALNGQECLQYIKTYKEDLSIKLLTTVNGILVKNTDVVYGGRLRFFPVKIEGSQHTPPAAEQVKPLLVQAMKWYSTNKRKLHPFELACLMHHKAAWIHPFEDGNGRTARAAMNFLLMKKGYPMFFIPVEKRQAYYEALDAADSGDEKTYVSQMLRLIIDQVRSYAKEK
jgi:Fic family protein